MDARCFDNDFKNLFDNRLRWIILKQWSLTQTANLIVGKVQDRIEQTWANFLAQGPQSQILCFRGPHSKLLKLVQNYIVTQ